MTEKYLDFSFEKTNSAYMLFYERRLPEHLREKHTHLLASPTCITPKTVIDSKESNNLEGDDKDKNVDKIEEKVEVESKMDFEDSDTKKVTESEQCDKQATIEKVDENEINKKMECDSENEKKEEEEKDMESPSTSTGSSPSSTSTKAKQQIDNPWRPQLSKELEDWIWQDNRQFLQDRNIFEHTYFK